MSKNKFLSLIKLNSMIVILNIILFSPQLVGLKLDVNSILITTVTITSVIMSIIIFIVGNYKILISRGEDIHITRLDTIDDFIYALKANSHKKTFSKDIAVLFNQIERLKKKLEKIDFILLQKFNSTEISYSKFKYTIEEIVKLFFLNLRSVINKIDIFDEEEYHRINKEIRSGRVRSRVMDQKRLMQNEYIGFVKEAIDDNEDILLKLDLFLLELSRFDSLEVGELENMDAMKEIDDLIKKIQMYK